jgi:hypothetical protein
MYTNLVMIVEDLWSISEFNRPTHFLQSFFKTDLHSASYMILTGASCVLSSDGDTYVHC